MKRFYVGLDVGTSGTKLVVFSEEKLDVVYKFAYNYSFKVDSLGRITVAPDDVLKAVKVSLINASAFLLDLLIDRCELVISLDTMLHSLLFLDGELNPIGNLVPWLDETGTQEAVEVLKNPELAQEVHFRTGCPVATTYPLYKLMWFHKNEAELLDTASKIGSIKDWLLYIFTGKHVVDESIASGSGCYDIRARGWAGDLLKKLANVDKAKFPDVVHGDELFEPSDFLKSIFDERKFKITVFAGTSDGAASSMGTTFGDKQMITISMGTSAAIRKISGEAPSKHLMKGYGPWCYFFDKENFIVGSATNNCGNVINWWKDRYLRSKDYSEYEKVLGNIFEDLGESPYQRVLFRPTVFGMRSTRWLPRQSAEFYNLTPNSELSDMTRAVLEGLVFKFRRAVEAVRSMDREHKTVAKYVASGGLFEIAGFGKLLATVLNSDVLYRKDRFDAVLGNVLFALRETNRDAFDAFVRKNSQASKFEPFEQKVEFYEILYSRWLQKMTEKEITAIRELIDV